MLHIWHKSKEWDFTIEHNIKIETFTITHQANHQNTTNPIIKITKKPKIFKLDQWNKSHTKRGVKISNQSNNSCNRHSERESDGVHLAEITRRRRAKQRPRVSASENHARARRWWGWTWRRGMVIIIFRYPFLVIVVLRDQHNLFLLFRSLVLFTVVGGTRGRGYKRRRILDHRIGNGIDGGNGGLLRRRRRSLQFHGDEKGAGRWESQFWMLQLL